MIKKIIRKIVKTLIFLVLSFTLLLALSYFLLRVGTANSVILDYAKRYIEKSSGWHFYAKRIESISPFAIRLREVKIDRPGVGSLSADKIALTFSPYRLLIGQVLFPKVEICDVELLADFTGSGEEKSLPSSTFFLPLSLHVEEFSLSRLQVADVEVDIQGEMRLSSLYQTATIDLFIEYEQQEPTSLSLSAYYEQDRIHIHARAAEEREGLLHHITGHLEDYSLELTVETSTKIGSSSLKANPSCGQFSILCTAPEESTAILGSNVRLSGCYDWKPQQGFTLSDLLMESILENSAIVFAADLDLTPSFALNQARFYTEIENIANIRELFSHSLGGSIQGFGTIKGSWDHPRFDLDFKTIGFSLKDKPFGDIRIQGEGDCTAESASASFALCSDVGPVVTTSTFDLFWDFSPSLTISDFHWQSPTAALRGDLQLSLPTYQLDGHLEGETGDLAWLIPKEMGEIHGSSTLVLDFISKPGEEEQVIDLVGEITRLDFGPLYGEHAELIAHVENALLSPSGELKVHAKDTRIGGVRVKDCLLQMALLPEQSECSFKLLAEGKWDSKFSLTSKGVCSPFTGQLQIAELLGDLQNQNIFLNKPATLLWAKNSLAIDHLSLAIGEGLLTTSGHISDRSSLDIELQEIPLEFIHSLLPVAPLEGGLSGQCSIKGSTDNPLASFTLSLQDMVVVKEGLINLPILHAETKGSLRNRELTIESSIAGVGKRPITLTAQLPIQASLLPFQFTPIADAPLRAELTASGEITPLLHLLFAEVNFSGSAHAALQISGSYLSPLVYGTVDLIDCAFEDLTTGSTFKNIQAQFIGEGESITLTSLTAQDGQQGVATGSGSISLNFADHNPFDLSFYLEQARVLRRDYVQATASGEIYLTGRLNDISLKGELLANSVNVTLPEQMPSSAASLDITFINTPTKVITPESKTELKLDVDIEIPNNVQVRSDDLRSQWQGNISITGSSLAPFFTGQMRCTKGDYRLNGKMFVLDRGTITFNGDLDKKTSIYIVAKQDIDQYVIEAVLKGPIRDPMLTLRSNPHLSQREILSWIIFNRGLNDITPFENDIAGQAVVDLSRSKNQTPDMMSKLRQIGIDRLDVTSQDRANSSELIVNVGKYLSRDCFVSLNKGITSDSNSLSLEANLIKNVKFQAEVDDEATAGVRLMWKYDY